MSSVGAGEGACLTCLRRSWLLSELSPVLDYSRGRSGQLRDLLALPDEQLIDALAGSRRESLHAAYRTLGRAESDASARDTLCRHEARYPKALADDAPPVALHLAGGPSRLARLMKTPAVLILGSREPSEYGTQMASGLARGLAASGITLITKLEPGVARAAQLAALRLGAGTLGVASDGLGRPEGGPRSALCADITRSGCVVSELPDGVSGRGWGSVACERVLIGLASLIVVIEATDRSQDLGTARLAIETGARVGAIPGHVGSPLSTGPHALIREGASLIRGARDSLEILYGHHEAAREAFRPAPGSGLGPHLRSVLDQVLSGNDTAEKILAGAACATETLAALSELEVAGVLDRTVDGRYTPRERLLHTDGVANIKAVVRTAAGEGPAARSTARRDPRLVPCRASSARDS